MLSLACKAVKIYDKTPPCGMFLPKFKGLVNELSREVRAIVFIFVSNWQEGLLCHSGGYCCGWENLNLYDSPLWWGGARGGF